MRIFPLSIFLLSLLLLAPSLGCGSEKKSSGKNSGEAENSKTTITIAAAASLKEAFDEAGRGFQKDHPEATLLFNYAASNILARQIEEGAPFDVVALAAEETMNGLDSAALLQPASRRIFARNRLCVVVSSASGLKAEKLSDLAHPSFGRIAVASPGVPARLYTEEALRKAGLWAPLQERFVYGANVRQVLGYVHAGEVECGFVYASDAQASEISPAFVVDSTLHRPILYPIAVVRTSSHQSLAEAFIAYLNGPLGKEILKRYGFE